MILRLFFIMCKGVRMQNGTDKKLFTFTTGYLHIYLHGWGWVDVVTRGVHEIFLIQRGSLVRWHLKSQMQKRLSQCFHACSSPSSLSSLSLALWCVLESGCKWHLRLSSSLWGFRAGFPSKIHEEESGLSGCLLPSYTELTFNENVSPLLLKAL